VPAVFFSGTFPRSAGNAAIRSTLLLSFGELRREFRVDGYLPGGAQPRPTKSDGAVNAP
jgi:hypothetical protein